MPPVLSMPDFYHEFYVATDASNLGVGVVLCQRIGDSIKYNCFASSSLSSSQKNYPTTKKELLGVVLRSKSSDSGSGEPISRSLLTTRAWFTCSENLFDALKLG